MREWHHLICPNFTKINLILPLILYKLLSKRLIFFLTKLELYLLILTFLMKPLMATQNWTLPIAVFCHSCLVIKVMAGNAKQTNIVKPLQLTKLFNPLFGALKWYLAVFLLLFGHNFIALVYCNFSSALLSLVNTNILSREPAPYILKAFLCRVYKGVE